MQTVLVTGANRGIGLAFTRSYLARGARVFATCRHPDDAVELQTLRQEYVHQLSVIQLDVTNAAQLALAGEQVAQQTAHLDVLINNAGVHLQTHSLSEVSEQDFSYALAVNVVAPLRALQTFLPLLEQSTRARVVNLTMAIRSISNLSRPGNQALVASRSALNALTKSLSLELGPKGMIIIALYPRSIPTDANARSAEAQPINETIPTLIDLIEGLTPKHNGQGLFPDGSTFF
jgi:NAD(P)-dependent dehydrogenase (short-subunit alcohol dehydrogenase family)